MKAYNLQTYIIVIVNPTSYYKSLKSGIYAFKFIICKDGNYGLWYCTDIMTGCWAII